MTIIFLVGFMGSGKTSVGRELANYLHYNFIDLDDLIIQEEKMSINEIFIKYGESSFRQLETKTLISIVNYKNAVISLGGGAYVAKENRDLIKKYGMSIWLQCDLQIILSRLANDKSRPLYNNPQQMQTLLESRIFAYQQTDFQINVSNLDIQTIVQHIAMLIK